MRLVVSPAAETTTKSLAPLGYNSGNAAIAERIGKAAAAKFVHLNAVGNGLLLLFCELSCCHSAFLNYSLELGNCY